MWQLSVLQKKTLQEEMAEELQKYKDILKREREEFKKQLEREVSISRYLLIKSKWTISRTKQI